MTTTLLLCPDSDADTAAVVADLRKLNFEPNGDLDKSKFDNVIENAETYVIKREWNGKNSRFTVRSHIKKHREAHNDMELAAEHISYEVPNGHTRVGRLLKSITSMDPKIVSSITHINGNSVERDNFEEASDFILLNAPNNGNAPEKSHRISGAKMKKTKKKNGTGDSGVEFRYYTKDKYRKLTDKQKRELSEWRKTKKSNDGNKENKGMSYK